MTQPLWEPSLLISSSLGAKLGENSMLANTAPWKPPLREILGWDWRDLQKLQCCCWFFFFPVLDTAGYFVFCRTDIWVHLELSSFPHLRSSSVLVQRIPNAKVRQECWSYNGSWETFFNKCSDTSSHVWLCTVAPQERANSSGELMGLLSLSFNFQKLGVSGPLSWIPSFSLDSAALNAVLPSPLSDPASEDPELRLLSRAESS